MRKAFPTFRFVRTPQLYGYISAENNLFLMCGIHRTNAVQPGKKDDRKDASFFMKWIGAKRLANIKAMQHWSVCRHRKYWCSVEPRAGIQVARTTQCSVSVEGFLNWIFCNLQEV